MVGDVVAVVAVGVVVCDVDVGGVVVGVGGECVVADDGVDDDIVCVVVVVVDDGGGDGVDGVVEIVR